MRINSESQAPRPPARERQPIAAEEIKERATKSPERRAEPLKPEGQVGRNLDTQA